MDRITDGWKAAMKSGDATRKETLSGLRAAVKRAEIDARGTANEGELDDEETQVVIDREAKKRREAIEEYTKAKRKDLADKEAAELAIIAEFLPKQFTDAELETIVRETVAEVGASSSKEMGAVMTALRPKIAGRADGKKASAMVKSALG